MYGLYHFLPLKTISKKVTHVVKLSFLSAHGSPLAIAARRRRVRPQAHVAVPDSRGRRAAVLLIFCASRASAGSKPAVFMTKPWFSNLQGSSLHRWLSPATGAPALGCVDTAGLGTVFWEPLSDTCWAILRWSRSHEMGCSTGRRSPSGAHNDSVELPIATTEYGRGQHRAFRTF